MAACEVRGWKSNFEFGHEAHAPTPKYFSWAYDAKKVVGQYVEYPGVVI